LHPFLHPFQVAIAYFHPDLAAYSRRAIVRADKHSFPAGRNWYGFHYMGAPEFWRRISDTR
jgi:hypothetical protein